MRIPGFLCRERLTVEPWTGASAHGDVYGAAVTPKPRAYVEPKRRLVKRTGGEEVVSEAIAYVCLPAPAFIPDSKVTRPDGTVYRVLSAATMPRNAGVAVLLGGLGATT